MREANPEILLGLGKDRDCFCPNPLRFIPICVLPTLNNLRYWGRRRIKHREYMIGRQYKCNVLRSHCWLIPRCTVFFFNSMVFRRELEISSRRWDIRVSQTIRSHYHALYVCSAWNLIEYVFCIRGEGSIFMFRGNFSLFPLWNFWPEFNILPGLVNV
jgi:hypothetical protein